MKVTDIKASLSIEGKKQKTAAKRCQKRSHPINKDLRLRVVVVQQQTNHLPEISSNEKPTIRDSTKFSNIKDFVNECP